MEGVGLVSIEGHPLLVRTLSGEFPTTYLLTLFSSEKFAKEQSDCSIILSESDTKKIGWRKKFEFILIGWFCKETNDDLVCRLLSYAEGNVIFSGNCDINKNFRCIDDVYGTRRFGKLGSSIKKRFATLLPDFR